MPLRTREQKRERRNKLLIGGIIAFIMIASVLGFVVNIGGDDESVSHYGEYTFIRKNNQWTTNVNDIELSFDYLPDQLENVKIEKNLLEQLKTVPQMGLTYDPTETRAQDKALAIFGLAQATLVTPKYFDVGLTEPLEGATLPIMDCDNATQYVPIMKFVNGNETTIRQEGLCLIATAQNGYDFLALKDKLLYIFIGILPTD